MQMKIKKFNMEEIHSGYSVKFRNGVYALCMRVGPTFKKIFVITGPFAKVFFGSKNEDSWVYADSYVNSKYVGKNKKIQPNWDIVAVYGLVEGVDNYIVAPSASYVDHRPLLWEEEVPKKMTLEEIEEKLGHKVEIVEQEKHPSKCYDTCNRCEFSVANMSCGHSGCGDCPMRLNKSVADRAVGIGTTRCMCNTIAQGEPCPFFKGHK